MSFTARQRHCLEAMGFVAWTSTEAPASHHSSADVQSVVLAPEAVDGDVVAPQPQVASVAVPTAVSELAQWLVDQPLALFEHRGVSVNCIGPEQAQLLVVCLVDNQHDEPGQLPMSAECAQMFELMMRAIKLSRNGLRQCAVLRDATSQSPTVIGADMVSSLCTPITRAVLVLDPTLDTPAADASTDTDIMPGSLQPLWRVPHPQQLIQAPILKRRAWESLKKLQTALAA